jgi:hypothetical protein
MPDATAAADPPDDPPVVCSVFHGLRVGADADRAVAEPLRDRHALVVRVAFDRAAEVFE